MKLRFQQKITLNYIMVTAKENLNRFYNYTKSFRDKAKATKLSEYIWQLTGESKS